MNARKLFALAGALALAFGVAMAAEKAPAQKASKTEPDMVKGTITAWDDATKTFKVKDESGQEHSMMWDASTKVHGTARVGEHVKVSTKMENGQMMATQIHIGEGSSKPPAEKKKGK